MAIYVYDDDYDSVGMKSDTDTSGNIDPDILADYFAIGSTYLGASQTLYVIDEVRISADTQYSADDIEHWFRVNLPFNTNVVNDFIVTIDRNIDTELDSGTITSADASGITDSAKA